MGASGSGKTTLMNILGCLDRPTSGQFWFDGEEMSQLTPNQRALVRTAKLGFVFQSFNLLPRTTALQNVVMPLDYSPARPHGSVLRHGAPPCWSASGWPIAPSTSPRRCRAGQQQRVAIARSLVNRPRAAAGRRAHRQPRLAHQRGNPADVPAAQRRGDHRHPGDARPEGGRLRPSHDPHQRRPDRGGREPHARGRRASATFPWPASPAPGPRRTATAAPTAENDGNGSGVTRAERIMAAAAGSAIHDGDGDPPRRRGRRRRRARGPGPRPWSPSPESVVVAEVVAAPPCRQHLGRRASAAAHPAHRPGSAAAKQDALGADRPGRDHRRGRRDRHGRNRPGLQDHDPEDDRQHGGQQHPGPAGGGRQRRRQLRRRQRDDAHAPRTATRSPGSVPPSATRPPSSAPVPRSSTATGTGFPTRCWARRPRSWPSAIGKISPKATSSPISTCATGTASAWWAKPSSANCSSANRPSARKSASKTSPSRSSACSAARAPT